MAGEWTHVSFSKLCDITRGASPRPIHDWFADVGIPWVKISDASSAQSRYITETGQYIKPEGRKKSVEVQPGDLILSNSATPGIPKFMGINACIHDGWLLLRNLRNLDKQFAYYLLLHERPKLVSQGNGSVFTNLKTEILKNHLVKLPPIAEQRAIAHILGTLDDKIELNRKQNETLEAMARALFKAWFVDFEPVRAKMEGRWQRGQSLPGLPAHLYDLFPDRLVESELGEIPEGWPIVSFGDTALQGKGSVRPGESPQDSFTHYSLPAFDAGQMPVNELGEAIKSNKTSVPDGAVLISKLNPHIPRVWLVGKAGDNAVCSTEFIVWTPKAPANSAFLYCLASSAEFNSAMRQLVTGTSNSHQRVKPEQLRDIRCIAAGSDAIKEFSAMALPWMNQLLRNRQQSRSLAQLRDTLLPKLISGELRIRDAEAFLKERGL